jgi:hypothetical protein
MHYRFTGRGRRGRGLAVAGVVLGALLHPACSDSTPTVPGVPRAQILVAVDPNPVIGVQNALTGSISAAYIVKIREAAGLGGEIQFVNSTVFDPETGDQRATNYFDSAALTVFVGTSRIEPGGELNVAQTTNYTLPEFRVNADLTVSVQFLDDRGGLINRSILARVVPPPAE